jgi:hypothetical protein
MDVVENAANKGKNAEKLLYNERSRTVLQHMQRRPKQDR